ncbi:MAG: tRNA (adenosine(37)-N6)-dimethylallyltransferase MiaA [Muribaculaceae bacterium]|nr:tRNA (adenosine(37)-N6)-dimethylallyltransferase MiaA [Muribaculaceae bacterium]
MKTLIVITGPTASGKTALAVEVARRLGCDIISADSRQIYRGMPIGTAAPTPQETGAARHHFVAMLDPGEYYSAAQFEQDTLALLPRLWASGDYAVMCGGSMMYVDAVVRGIDELPTISPEVRAEAMRIFADEGKDGIVERLRELDPLYLEEVDLNNHKRLVHALEICMEAGVPYSSLRTGAVRKRDFRILKFAVDMPREELFARINRRVELMLEAGLVDEARALMPLRGENALNTVGYKEMFRYLDGEWDLPTAMARMQKNTRVYAKKQLTWLRRDPDVIWIAPGDADAIMAELRL